MSSKRRRSSRDSEIKESETREVIPRFILPDEAISTSSWNSKVTKLMKINVSSEEIFSMDKEENSNPLYLDFMTDNMWGSNLNVEDLSTSNAFRSLILKVNHIYSIKDVFLEQEVDTYIQTLLRLLGMDDYPLTTSPHYKLFVEIGENLEKITSESNFVVKSFRNGMIAVIEDKNNTSAKFANQWRENQMLGKIFAAAHNVQVEKSHVIYGVRVISTLFTFFQATVTEDYIRESSLGLPERSSMNVIRYPNPGESTRKINALDFCKLNDRKRIIKHFEKIKEDLLTQHKGLGFCLKLGK